MLATWDHHFTAVPGDFRAQPFEATADVEPVGAAAGDRLVFRYASTGGATVAMAYIPNGEGARANGRIPFVELPR